MQSYSRWLYIASQSEEGVGSPLSLQMFVDAADCPWRPSDVEKPFWKPLVCSLSIWLYPGLFC